MYVSMYNSTYIHPSIPEYILFERDFNQNIWNSVLESNFLETGQLKSQYQWRS